MSNQDLEDQIDQKELTPGILLIKEYKKVENDPNREYLHLKFN